MGAGRALFDAFAGRERTYALREAFNGLRYVVKTGAPWHWMPNDRPPWEIVYQQAQRWLLAGCFETLARGGANRSAYCHHHRESMQDRGVSHAASCAM
jgi:transposase